jgi:membrane protein DedA with SNARE-associated domain
MDEKVQAVFLRWGDKVVFLARFMPGLRTPIFLTAGIYKTSYARFLALDGSAALISVPVWIWIGELFGYNLELLAQKMKQFQVAILVAVAIVLLFLFIRNRWFATRVSPS